MKRAPALTIAGATTLAVLLATPPCQAQAAEPRRTPDLTTLRQTTPLPQAVASFGACSTGGFVWVFGGHVGRAHDHSRTNVVGTFQRFDLAAGGDWQALPSGPALQGTALVAGPGSTVWR
ncbi:MAG: hypothetical protein WAT39_25450, partial [Planctomycetota bacterium]